MLPSLRTLAALALLVAAPAALALVASPATAPGIGASTEVRFEGTITARGDVSLWVGPIRVLLTDATDVRGDGGPPRDQLVPGVRVEVWGSLDEVGDVIASRIDIEDDSNEDEDVEVKAPIEALGAASVTVASQTFAVTGTTAVLAHDRQPILFSALRVGQLVEVRGTAVTDRRLEALSIRLEDFSDDEVELTGAIETLGADAVTVAGLRFEVSGETVVLDDDRQPIALDALAVGLTVEVRADTDAGGARHATRIRIEDRFADEVGATVALDGVGAGFLVALGRAFAADSPAVLPDGLGEGDVVELHASRLPSGELVADGVDVREDHPASDVQVEAPVTAVGADTLWVIDVPFSVDGTTQLVGRDGTPTTLAALSAGLSVAVEATATGTGLIATRVAVRAAARAQGRVEAATTDGFSVGGVAVTLAPDARVVSASGQPLPTEHLASGQTVSVVGTADVGGAITATRVVVLAEASATAAEAGPDGAALGLTVFPNPLAGPGAIRYTLAAPARVSVVLYSTLGREVARLGDGAVAAGSHVAAFDVRAIPSGLYLVRVFTDGRPAATTTLTVAR